jgi:transposase-like protein
MMRCPKCDEECPQRYGKNKQGVQRWRCTECGKTWMEPTYGISGKMRLSEEMVVKCLKLMLDGMSIRAIERFTGVTRWSCRERGKHGSCHRPDAKTDDAPDDGANDLPGGA